MKRYFLSLILLLTISIFVYGQDMKKESMEAKYKTVYNEALNALTSGNLSTLDKIMTQDMIEHDPSPMMTKKTGIDKVKEIFTSYHKIFPDMKAKVHNTAVSGDYLFAYITFTGTAAEPYMGMPAGHKMTMDQVDLVRFKGDKISEHWGFTSNTDIMKMEQQNSSKGKKK
jgi:predicted SnoaL-like aldol condensation-catalyzing enzyme